MSGRATSDFQNDLAREDSEASRDYIKIMAVKQVFAALAPLSPDERADVIAELPYCEQCWDDRPPHGKCQCD